MDMSNELAEVTRRIPGRSYVAGVDVANEVDYTVISIIDTTTHEQVYMDRFNRVGYVALEERISAVAQRWGLLSLLIESNSIGQPVIDHLAGRGLSIVPFKTTSTTKQPLIQNLQSAFEFWTGSDIQRRAYADRNLAEE